MEPLALGYTSLEKALQEIRNEIAGPFYERGN
jgi:hypothetical protein